MMTTPCSFIASAPPDHHDRKVLARWLFEQQDYVNAAFLFASLHQADLDARQWMTAGESAFRAGLATKWRAYFKQAVRAFHRADRLLGAGPETSCWLARAYGYLALHTPLLLRPVYALSSRWYAQRALRAHPDHAFSHYVLGLWHQRMPRWIGGEKTRVSGHLEKAISLDPSRIAFRYAMAKWNLTQQRFEAAYSDLKVMLELPTSDPDDDRRKIEAIHLLQANTDRIVRGRYPDPTV